MRGTARCALHEMMPHSHCVTGFRRGAGSDNNLVSASTDQDGRIRAGQAGLPAATRLNCFPWPLPAFSGILHDHSLELDRSPTCIHPGCTGSLTCTTEPLARGHRPGRATGKSVQKPVVRGSTRCPEVDLFAIRIPDNRRGYRSRKLHLGRPPDHRSPATGTAGPLCEPGPLPA